MDSIGFLSYKGFRMNPVFKSGDLVKSRYDAKRCGLVLSYVVSCKASPAEKFIYLVYWFKEQFRDHYFVESLVKIS